MTGTSLLSAVLSKMKWDAKNQEIIAQNLSRARIPGALTKELKPFNFKEALEHGKKNSTGLSTTNTKHMGNLSDGSFKTTEVKHSENETLFSGNNISPEEELRKLNETSTDYFKMLNIYKNFVTRYKLILQLGK